MAKETSFTFICDLCGASEKRGGDVIPENWVSFIPWSNSITVNTKSINTHVCDKCCLAIKQKHKG